MPAKIPKPSVLNSKDLHQQGLFSLDKLFGKDKSQSLTPHKTQTPAVAEKKTSNNVQEHLKDYLLAVSKTGCSSSTIRNYRSDINQFLDFTGNDDLDDLRNKPKLLAFAHYQRNKGLKENSIKRKLVSVTQFKIWLKQQGLISSEIPLANLQIINKTNQVDEKEQQNELFVRKIIDQKETLEAKKEQTPDELSKKEPKKKQKPQSRIFLLLNILALVLFLGGLAYFAYQQFGQAIISLAYPSTPTAPNRILSYQGRLTNTAQSPIADPTPMTYALYDDVTGGNLLWSSNTCTIDPDQDGIFNANLGAGSGTGSDNENCGGAIDENVFTLYNNVWLEVTVDSETLDPRQPIRTVAYALNSATLQGLPPAEIASHSTILMMNESGELVLGTDNPVIKAATTSSGMTIEANQITIKTTAGSNGDIILAPDGDGILDIQGNASVSGNTTLIGNLDLTSPNNLIFGGTTALGEISSPTDSGAFLIGVADEFDNSNSTNIQGVLNDLDAAIMGAGTQKWSTLTAPNANLSLNHGTYTTGFNWATGTGSDNLFSLTTDASSNGTGSLLNLQTGASSTVSPLRIRAGSTEALFVNSSGNVGIGSTTPTSFKLQVAGHIGPETDSTYDLGSNDIRWANGYFDTLYGNGSNLTNVTASSVPFSGISGGTNTTAAMVVGAGASLNYTSTGTINASSLLGNTWAIPGTIGSTTPNTGAFTTLSSTGNTTVGDAAGDTLTANAASWSFPNTTSFDLKNSTANALSFESGLLSFDTANSRVGIGDTSPSYKLDLAGVMGMNGEQILSDAGTANLWVGRSGILQSGSSYNIGLGFGALNVVSSGSYNTAIGAYALAQTTTGGANTAIGQGALQALSVAANTHNIGIGQGVGWNLQSGYYNTFIGDDAGGGSSTYTNSDGNILIGYSAGYGISGTSIDHNIAIGQEAGYNLTGDGNIFLGYKAGYNETGSNKLYIDNSDTSSPLIWGDFSSNILAVNGSLGIGDTSPDHTLDVAGNIGMNAGGYLNFGDTDGSSGYGIRDNSGNIEFKNSGGVWAELGSGSGDSYWQLTDNSLAPTNTSYALNVGSTASSSALFHVPGTINQNAWFNLGSGNLGVGTATPSATLHVVSDSTYATESQGGSSTFSLSGTGQTWNYDDGLANYALPFTFPFFGEDVTNIQISSNGSLWMCADCGDNTGYPSATDLPLQKVIAPLWGDWVTDGTGQADEDIYIDESTPNQVTIRWRGEVYGSSSDVLNFSVTLYSTGNIVFQYGSGNTNLQYNDGENGMIAVSNGNGAYFVSSLSGASSQTNTNDLTITTTEIPSLFAVDNSNGNLLTVLATGQVGIGTTTPNNLIQVEGLINFDDSLRNVFLGHAGTANTTGNWNTAIGDAAMENNTTGFSNTAVGVNALRNNYSGSGNTALGMQALATNYDGHSNTAVGEYALNINSSGYYNTAQGYRTLYNNSNGSYNTAFGSDTLLYNSSGNNNVVMGYQAGYGVNNNSNSNNIFLGYKAADNVATGSNNIVLGYDIDLPSASSNNQLVIGNLIYGTGINGTGTTLSSGNIGIGTSSPSSKFHVVAASGEGNPSYDGNNSLITQYNSSASDWNRLNIISGSTGASVLEFGDKDDANAGFIKYDNASNQFVFSTNSTDSSSSNIVIDSSGNLGIGVATPSSRLDIGGATSTISNDTGDITIDAASGNVAFSGNNLTNVGDGLFSGLLGVGTTSPDRKVEILDTSGPQLRLTYTDASIYADFHVNSSSDLVMNMGGVSNQLVLDSSGYVGIGTNSPNEMLMVNGGVNAEKYYDLTNKSYYLDPASVGIGLKLAGSAEIAGNIGIGTASSGYKLSIGGSTSIIANTSGDITIDPASGNLSLAGNNIINVNDGFFTRVGVGTTDLDGILHTSTSIATSTPIFERSGQSTDSWFVASRLLTTKTSNMADGFGTGMTFNIQDDAGVINPIAGIAATRAGADNSGSLQFITYNAGSSAYNMTILPSGNVGIGTNSPNAKLDISQSASFNTTTPGTGKYGLHLTPSTLTADYATGITFGADTSSGTTAQAGIYSQFSGSYGTKLYFATTNSYATGAITQMIIDQSGNVGIGITNPTYKLQVNGQPAANGYTAFTNYSDERLKENVKSLDSGFLDKILALNPSTFNYNKLTGYDQATRERTITGFIAQQLQNIFPEMVGTTTINGTEYLDTNLSALPIYLVKAMQELNDKVSNSSLAQLQFDDLSFDDNGNIIIAGADSATYAIATPTGLIDRLAAFADVFTARLQAGWIQTKELVTDTLLANNAHIEELTAPNLSTDTIVSGNGQVDIDSSVTVAGNLDASGNLSTGYDLNVGNDLIVTGESKLGQLLAGDTTINGTLTASKVDTDELVANATMINADATVSGTLYANKIEADSISANVISGLRERLSEQITETLSQPTLLATLLGNQNQQNDEYLNQLSQEINGSASDSADLTDNNDLDTLLDEEQYLTVIADQAFVNQYFEVNGSAFIAEALKLGQSLLIGEDTVYGNNFISYQPSITDNEEFTFYIQPAGIGKLSLMADLMQLDGQGFVTINGDLKVAGVLEVEEQLKVKDTLLTNLISANNPGENIQVQLSNPQVGSDSAPLTSSNFEFIDEKQNPVATVSANGDLALAGSLRLGQNTPVASEAGELTNHRSAGQAVLAAGSTEVTIMSDKVEEGSMIYVTPMNSTNNQVLYVKNKITDSTFTPENEAQFTVAIDYALGHNVVFNWWIIQLN